MYSRILKTTTLLLGLLTTTGKTDSREINQDAKALLPHNPRLHHPHAATCLPTEENDFLKSPTDFGTPVINESFLKSIIISNNTGITINDEDVTNAAKTIMALRESDPIIAQYIDLALTHLDGFTLRFLDKSDFVTLSGKSNLLGFYIPGLRSISTSAPSQFSNPFMDYNAHLRHEFCHAARHAMQETLSGKKTLEHESYYPINTESREAITAMFAEGYDNVKQLETLLQTEREGSINAYNQKKLQTLRELSKDIYLKLYAIYQYIPVQSEHVSVMEKEIGKLIIGKQTVFRRAPLNTIGPVEITKITKKKGKITLKVKILDPLYAAVSQINLDKLAIQKSYASAEQLHEVDAYLFGAIPTILIKELFPSFFTYIQKLMHRTASHSPLVTYRMTSQHYIGASDLRIMALLQHFIHNPLNKGLSAEIISQAIEFATVALNRGYIKEAKEALIAVLKSSHHKNKAKMLLANIEYLQKNYPAAANLWKQVAKAQGKDTFSADERRKYKESLRHAGFFKAADKEARKTRGTTEKPSIQLGR